MQRRKVIIYSIFAATLAYGAYFHFLLDDGNRSRVSRAPFQTDDVGPAMAGANANSPTQSSARGMKDGKGAEEWIGDPFRNDHKYRKRSTPLSVKKTPVVQRPRVSAISISELGAMAVVDGRVVAIGERIGHWSLIEVTEDAALFEGPQGSVWIKLGGSK